MVPLVLASRSPRRSELLHRLGLSFETDAPDVDEFCTLPAKDAVLEIASRKASAAASLHPGCFILSADTLVACDGRSLGKPSDKEEAFQMLHALSGRTHQVYTGVVVVSPSGERFAGVETTDVSFISMTDREINFYISTGEPMDKAGAYALQGMAGMWIAGISGSDTSVIGLPLCLVRDLLLRAGYPLFDSVRRLNSD